MDDVAIKVDSVSKSFKLPHEKAGSVKNAFVGIFSGKRTYEKQEVLKDISFEIKKGEFFGIVGRNGSGKSTLLKLMAGIYSPGKGAITVNGKLTPFIELGVGFNMELTGRENVFLNGALLGFNRKEMDVMYDDIVKFAELGRFMDQKLKNYSSGMQVRLAFSIAIRAKSDVLLIDEVLAVGDAAFQSKCFDVFTRLKEEGRTIVLVTHDMNSVLRFCDKVMLIEKGRVLANGNTSEVADKYLELNYKSDPTQQTKNKSDFIRSAKLYSGSKVMKSGESIETGAPMKVSVSYRNSLKGRLHFGMQIFNEEGVYCFGTNTKIMKKNAASPNDGELTVEIPSVDLLPGVYYITIAILSENGSKVIDYNPRLIQFRIAKNTEIEGIANMKHSWEIKERV